MPGVNQSCGNCYFMKPQIHMDAGKQVAVPCCRFEAPQPSGSIQSAPALWATVDIVNDWCGHWSTDGSGVFVAMGPAGPAGPEGPIGKEGPPATIAAVP